MSFTDAVWDIFHLWAYVIILITSYICCRPIAGHSLSIKRISLRNFSLHDVHCSGLLYRGTYAYTFTSSRIHIRFHIPSSSDPRWCTFTADSLIYIAPTCDISVQQISAVLWFFPVLFRRTYGPWTDVALDGFRIRVNRSRETPFYIKLLRENIVETVLAGELLRVDDFRTSIQMTGLSQTEQSYADSNCNRSRCDSDEEDCEDTCMLAARNDDDTSLGRTKATRIFLPTEEDEVRISALARQLHINNTEGRMYTFGAVDAQLRRNWMTDKGSFAMVVEDARWVKVQRPYQRERTVGWWAQLITAIFQFPFDLMCVIEHPVSSVNLSIPRSDITFDEFRLRDAELVMQTLSLLREKSITSGIDWPNLFFDTVAQMLATR